jgi:hypothetical protein
MAITLLNDVMNPEPLGVVQNQGVFAGTEIAAESLAKRLDSLEGKTIYLVDIGYGGSYKFMNAIYRWFQKNMPSVTTVRKRKAGSAFRDDAQELWEEIKSRGQAAVIGVGG